MREASSRRGVPSFPTIRAIAQSLLRVAAREPLATRPVPPSSTLVLPGLASCLVALAPGCYGEISDPGDASGANHSVAGSSATAGGGGGGTSSTTTPVDVIDVIG